jgi:GTP-binding protein
MSKGFRKLERIRTIEKTPVVVLAGRQNVGKSTLFNRLTRSRQALVADYPGLTRDRHYGRGLYHDLPFIVVDTGGFTEDKKDPFAEPVYRQLQLALAEADVVYFVVDARAGLQPEDIELAKRLRQGSAQVVVVANKAEGQNSNVVTADFYQLGFGEPLAISASHGDFVGQLLDETLSSLYRPEDLADQSADEEEQAATLAAEEEAIRVMNGEAPNEEPADSHADESEHETPFEIRIAVIGRPNAGKSTLINALLGHQQLMVSPVSGTTRDSIEIPFLYAGHAYILIDTAGVRKRGKVGDLAEKVSVIKTLDAIEKSQVVILVMDASAGIGTQETHLAQYAMEAGKAMVVVFNKWDSLGADDKKKYHEEFERRCGFLNFATPQSISAMKGTGLKTMMGAVERAHASAMVKMSTGKLNNILRDAVARQAPPFSGLYRPKLRYANQGGKNPPMIVIHGNSLNKVGGDYKRYLEKAFVQAFALEGTPLHIKFKNTENPYAHKARRI